MKDIYTNWHVRDGRKKGKTYDYRQTGYKFRILSGILGNSITEMKAFYLTYYCKL